MCLRLCVFVHRELTRIKGFRFSKKRWPCGISTSSSHFAHCMQFDYEIAIVTRRWNAWYVAYAVPNNNRCEFTHIYLLLSRCCCLFFSNYHHLFDIINTLTRTHKRALALRVCCENPTKVRVCVCFQMRPFGLRVFLSFFRFMCVTVITVDCLKLLIRK